MFGIGQNEIVVMVLSILGIIYGILMFFMPVFIFQIRDHLKVTNRLLKEQNEMLKSISIRP